MSSATQRTRSARHFVRAALRNAGAALALALVAHQVRAADIARADLTIVGVSVEVDRRQVVTAVDLPSYIQTTFSGNSTADLVLVGELTGPGIEEAITLSTVPGQKFAIPPLHTKGEYSLQNIRLLTTAGKFVQQATPSFASILVSDVLSTAVSVSQLTPDQLRARGITLDPRNYDAYSYSIVMTVGTSTVEVPYLVLVDRSTHEIISPPAPAPYALPPLTSNNVPPRFQPPEAYPIVLADVPDEVPFTPAPSADRTQVTRRPTIPATVIIPNGFGVLHGFFAVLLNVSNAAPAGAEIRLDSITATIDAPLTLRVAKTVPGVGVGQPLPIVDKTTGATLLIAGAQGSGEWTLEALKAGTHTVDIEVRATYKAPNQPDTPLRGKLSASVVVSDPRFHVTFSHPDVTRADEPFSAYSFVTNLSPQTQVIRIDSGIVACTQGYTSEVCRTDNGNGVTELTLAPGAMETVVHRLKSRITGHYYAAASAASDAAIGVDVKLTMGVSATGIPLSPATLVMPWYARYLDPSFVDANLGLLGLGYSLATAPLTATTAKFPRVIKTDVFRRARDITRAGQRIFISRRDVSLSQPAENRDALFNLALDLLDNVAVAGQVTKTAELAEWDQLRRSEESGRRAGAAMARQLEQSALDGGKSLTQFVDDFAAATNHRAPYLLALVHGSKSAAPRPFALALTGASTRGKLDVPADVVPSGCTAPPCAGSSWTRSLPFAELTKLSSATESGELAIVGRWKEDLELTVIPQSDRFTADLLFPDAADGAFLRSTFEVTGATPGAPVTFMVSRGARTIIVNGGTAVPLVNPVPPPPLHVVAAAQDLHLDDGGHVVSMLFNRPIAVADAAKLRDAFSITTKVDAAAYEVTRRNSAGQTFIPGASLQEDGTIVNVSFDKALSTNASYLLAADSIADAASAAVSSFSGIVPRIDNNAPGGLLSGKVLRADNTPVEGAVVQLFCGGRYQYEVTSGGRYLFEFIPRDIDRYENGNYVLSSSAEGKYTEAQGTIRLPGKIQTVDLMFLGRGSATGVARYSDGSAVAKAGVTISSPVFGQFRNGSTDASGRYSITDLPVGPLTFVATDSAGRTTYATNQIRTPGELVTQDLLIQKATVAGTATVRVTVRRSDVADPAKSIVPNARVGVYSRGFGISEATTDANGRYEFTRVPAGSVSILAADFNLTRESAAIDLEVPADAVIDQTIVLHVPTASDQSSRAILQGSVTRDDPLAPNNASKDSPVAGAVLTIAGLASATADAQGAYVLDGVPLAYGGVKSMQVFDPATGRRGSFVLPTLVSGANSFSVRLQSSAPAGVATMRVRLTGPRGEPVSGYRVLSPYFPPIEFSETAPGVYERPNVSVPQQFDVWALPKDPKGGYGEQFAHGSVRVDFDGQVGIADLHLPGQGTINVKLEVAQPCQNPPCYAPATGPVILRYAAWSEAEQSAVATEHRLEPDPATGIVTAKAIPALQDVTAETIDNAAGFASGTTRLAFDGDAKTVTLRLSSMAEVSGRVFMPDGQTPVGGASVRLEGSVANAYPVTTKADGSFAFSAVAANQTVRVIAEVAQDGIYRTGFTESKTAAGGIIANVALVLREQSSIEGRVVDAAGAVVPLARYWLRELSWPYRTFGSPAEPLFADRNGHFVTGNLFTGPFRITAVSPDVQEVRGEYQGEVRFEGDTSQRNIQLTVGGAGTTSISVLVVNPQNAFAPVPNAEVSLLRNGVAFDFATTDGAGLTVFDRVPAAGTYSVRGFSKALGRAGTGTAFTVAADVPSNVTLTLEFRGLVSGSVHDPEGAPAGVVVKGSPVTLQQTALTTRASTNSEGVFEFSGIPEGSFSLEAFDVDSGRRASGPAGLFISKLYPERTGLHLELERTATLGVKVFLPDDSGHAGVLAPLCDVIVKQRDGAVYLRELQGNDLSFKRMFAREGFTIEARELGGEGRIVKGGGSFASGAYEATATLIFPTSGSVHVSVRDSSGAAVTDARVIIAGGGRSATLYTGASGDVALDGFALGPISVQASKGTVAASASGTLASHSAPLTLTLNLGATASIVGGVDAETGGPSAGTSVSVRVTSRLLTSVLQLDTITDATGAYRFDAIPIGGTTVALSFVAPDDVTVGATLSRSLADTTSGTVDLGRVRLDATPPRVISIDPPNNANNVSPNSMVSIVLSEPVPAQYLTTAWFQLIATDDGRAVNAVVGSQPGTGGTQIVTLTAPDPTPDQVAAGQKYRLRSNVVYRVAVVAGIQDATGNAMATTVGAAFTTTNYTEPVITSITPAVDLPLPQQTTFRVRFNKAIDESSFTAGNGGVIRLEQLQAYKGSPLTVVETTWVRDPADASTMVIAPRTAIVESSFYRLTISGARDTSVPPNIQAAARSFDFFSFDTKKPVVAIGSPVPDGYPLISGVAYTVTPAISDEGTQVPSADTAYVDWFDGSGAFITRAKSSPFAYTFVAPSLAPSAQFTLKASATDLSGNTSASLASRSWSVAANEAPKETKVTTDVASAYPGKAVTASVSFTDEGLAVTVALDISGVQRDGTAWSAALGSQKITRAAVSDPWLPAKFTFNVPAALKEGSATLTATATDSAGKSASSTSTLEVLADTVAPEIISLLPAGETHFTNGQTLTVEVRARDGESGIAKAVISIGTNGPVTINAGAAGSILDAATSIWTFRTSITVPRRNADTRTRITAAIYDGRDNAAAASADVVYDRVNDPAVPVAAWITPLDGAAVPSGQTGWLTTLRVRATGNITQVTFSGNALSAPVVLTSPKNGTTDVYETKAALTLPNAGSSTILTATVSDGVAEHLVELPITLDVVSPDASILSNDLAITATNAPDYANRSLLLRGPNARLFVYVPLTLKNLIVVDGAVVGNPTQTRLDLTISDRLFVDGDSSVDLTARGYLGGWATRDDGTGRNESQRGQTAGATTTGGALAAASHAGNGGESPDLTTNTGYGSLFDPADFGAGGGGAVTCCTPGGSGGGAIALRGGAGAADLSRLVIAGAIRADGESGIGRAFPGAGGSVLLNANALIAGGATRITANGGDDEAALNESRGGGGGRVAIFASRRFDAADASIIEARGGRNGVGGEGTAYCDGGAGTIVVRRSGETHGSLTVSSYDARFPSSTHLVRGTPIGGTPSFDSLAVTSRALARFDTTYTVSDAAKVTVATNALLLNPSDVPAVAVTATLPATTVIQDAAVVTTFDASSLDGIDHVRASFTGAGDATSVFGDHPPFVIGRQITTVVPAAATPGPATMKLKAVSRSGRVVETAAIPFTVVANTAPAITRFEVTPADGVYAGRTVTVVAAAADDVEVKSMALTSSIGAVTAGSAALDSVNHTWTQSFSIAVPVATASGTAIQLTLSVSDNFPGRGAIVQTKSVPVLKDSNAPVVTLNTPAANQIFDEGSANTIGVEVTATDGETGVKRVFATLDAKSYDLAAVAGRPNVYAAAIPVPNVDGIDLVPKSLTVTASDFESNQKTIDPVTIRIRPLNDPNAPALSWTCGSPGATYPAGGAAKLRVYAKGNTTANGVAKVEFFVGDPATVTTAVAVAGVADNYEATITLPAGADGTSVPIRAVATSVGGNSADRSTSVTIYNGTVFTANSSIAAGDTQYEGKAVFVRGAVTLTIAGHHEFTAFAALDGATVVHPATTPTSVQRLDISAQSLFVSCDSRIDVTGRGFAGSVGGVGYTYKDSTSGSTAGGSSNNAAGSHGGRGGIPSDATIDGSATPYGSLFDPNEPGGSASAGTCSTCGAGGGIVRIAATSVAIDGTISANGVTTGTTGGAGGSIRIDAATLAGSGQIRADGSDNGATGGGGRVALYAQASNFPKANVSAAGGKSGSQQKGTAGTIYICQVDSNRNKVADEIIIDNPGNPAAVRSTPFASLGAGTVSGISANVVTTSAAVPEWIDGCWIEFLDGVGAVGSTYRVASHTATTVTLEVPPNSTMAVAPGAPYRAVWRFDAVTARNYGAASFEALRTPSITTSATSSIAASLLRNESLAVAGVVKVKGTVDAGQLTLDSGSAVEVDGLVKAQSLVLRNASKLLLMAPVMPSWGRLRVQANSITVDSTSAIDANGRGLVGTVALYGYTYKDASAATTTGGSYDGAGGSHGGRGSRGNGESAPVYGSIFDPDEPGGAGSGSATAAGGGVIRIAAGSIALDGSITASGVTSGASGQGAGGSIRIDASTISGNGQIHADGASNGRSGGGGRIAIYSDGLSLPRANITAAGGSAGADAWRGSAGTIYLKRSTQPNGELIVDNLTNLNARATNLPSIGLGTITGVDSTTGGGPDRLTDSNAAFPMPNFLAGLRAAIAADLTKSWLVKSHDAKSLILDTSTQPFSGSVGQTYRGIARFDVVRLRNSVLTSFDVIDALSIDKDAASSILSNEGPPVFSVSLRPQIAVSSSAAGDFVVAPAGAVADADLPVKLTARNTRTLAQFTGNASADGSFRVAIDGAVGDTFTMSATDSHISPLTSETIAVAGSIAEANGVASLTLLPDSVTGGGTAEASIRLLNPARTGGCTVALSSSDSAAMVPSSVVVPQGASVAQVAIATTSVSTAASATITATLPSAAKSAVLQLLPASGGVAAFAIAPSVVTGGATAVATITLSAPAPAGGAVVGINSSNPAAASAPSSVTVAAGSSSATFTIATTFVATSTSATFSAFYGNTQTATLTVNACTSMAVPPAVSAPAGETVWFDDALPAGATASGSASFATTYAATGTHSLQFPAATGSRQWSMTGAPALNVTSSDRLIAYVLLDPCNPPREIVLAWSDGSNEYRATWGDDLIDVTTAHKRVGTMPAPGAWTRLEVLATTLAAHGRSMRGLTIKAYDGQLWIDRVGTATCTIARATSPDSLPNDRVWMDDDLPPGAVVTAKNSPFQWDVSQSASGARAHHLAEYWMGTASYSFDGATNPLKILSGDVLVTYVLVNPCKPVREVMLEFIDENGSWEHRAYWGENELGGGTDGTPSRMHIGPVPEPGVWTRLEVPASLLGLEGHSIRGMSFDIYGGDAWFDRSGAFSRANLARGKAASQSSNYGPASVASRAVDGDTSGAGEAVTAMTASEASPWWQADLGAVQPVEHIVLWNRTDCCATRLQKFWLFVSEQPFASTSIAATRAQQGVFSYYCEGPVATNYTFRIGRSFRYVRVQLAGTDVLQLAEFEAFAPSTGQRANLAGGAAATQSATSGSASAERAIDGNIDGKASTSSDTGSAAAPWWQVDLGSVLPVSFVDVWNRTDCCTGNLANYYVFASDAPFAAVDPAQTALQAGVTPVFISTATKFTRIRLDRPARYIRIQLKGTSSLTLGEVQVWSGQPVLRGLSRDGTAH